MPVFPPLVSPEELLGLLGDERLRIFDATVVLSRAVAGGPYAVQSGRPGYERAHIPGAAFADGSLRRHVEVRPQREAHPGNLRLRRPDKRGKQRG